MAQPNPPCSAREIGLSVVYTTVVTVGKKEIYPSEGTGCADKLSPLSS